MFVFTAGPFPGFSMGVHDETVVEIRYAAGACRYSCVCVCDVLLISPLGLYHDWLLTYRWCTTCINERERQFSDLNWKTSTLVSQVLQIKILPSSRWCFGEQILLCFWQSVKEQLANLEYLAIQLVFLGSFPRHDASAYRGSILAEAG